MRYKFTIKILGILLIGLGGFLSVANGAPGDLDTTFSFDGIVREPISKNGNDIIYAIAIQPDGKFVAVGIGDYGTATACIIARYNSDGSFDSSFDGDGKNIDQIQCFAVAVQTDGKIVVAGNLVRNGNSDFALARYNADGSLDTSFGTGGKILTSFGAADIYEVAKAVAVRPDGKIVVAGESGGATAIAVFNTDGSFDTSFDGDGKLTTNLVIYVEGLAIQSNGKILVAGSGSNAAGYDMVLARFNTDGSFDTSFDGDGIAVTDFGDRSDSAFAVKVQTDGKIIAAGFAGNNTDIDFALVRYNADGSLDTSFDGDGKVTTDFLGHGNYVRSIAIQPDGKIVAAGGASNVVNSYEFGIVRYNPNGSLDTSFDDDGKVLTPVLSTSNSAGSVVVQTDGKIVVAGHAGIDRAADFGLIRYNSNGSLDGSYGTGGKAIFDIFSADIIYGMALDSTGRAVVAGESGGLLTVARVLGGAASPTAASPYDFDGDGKTDIAIYRPSAGQWWINSSSTGVTSAAQFGNPTDKIVPGDFSGDGKADIAVWRPSSGAWFILRSENSSFYSVPFGASGDVPVPADFDGDGLADVAVYRPSNFTWYISKSSGGTQIISFGATGDVPVTGDYDGDDKSDIAIYRPSTGEWWISRSSTSSTIVLQFGTVTDIPVQGDYTGDGRTDIALFRPSTGFWYVLRSEDNSFYTVPFGATGDIPTPGDYDGDGKFDTAIFRPSDSNWYINRSTSGLLITTFGVTGDKPVPSAFLP